MLSQEEANTIEKQPSTPEESGEETNSFLLSADMITEVTQGTMLEGRPLRRVYFSEEDGFSNEIFFDCQMALGGVPSLLLGVTESGIRFGGYTANGFLARDDYRETSSAKSMFVFTIVDGQLVVAEPTDQVQYDFYDYAVRFGAGLLGIPMNPGKHIMKADMATSSCRLPNGGTSLFGKYTMSKLKVVEVLVDTKYVDELEQKSKNSGKSFFARLFG